MYSENVLIIVGAIVVLGILVIIILLRSKAAPAKTDAPSGPSTLPLQLQAYERLVILAERIGLRYLIGSQSTEGLSAREYQAVLVEAIKREYEYNVSQQIYVAPKAWEAVQRLKEQNIYVVNQIGSYLNGDAGGKDLARALAEYLSGQGDAGALQQIVMDGLNIEAKKLMH